MSSEAAGNYGKDLPQRTPFPLAPLGLRLAAYVLDFVALIGFFVLLTILGTLLVPEQMATPQGFQLVLLALFVAAYSPGTTSRWGGTPGKLLCGLRVVTIRDGRELGYGRALARHLSHVVLYMIPLVGLINSAMPLWDRPYRQCLHDKIVDTVVIRRRL
ncbi:RDD family protein [Nonomuraea sp. SYSU D8015]|uniref:RDD family protein n=1 Tax=Nonomuraea sp. SYSU D8015 TaxID=2593644 RepID=UPI0016614313|nr:RDD family protein [Nonomuraea sp. SYSU D8015]